MAESLKVVRAAINEKTGGVHSVAIPGRHHDVVAQMKRAGVNVDPVYPDQFGFLLSDGRFVRRRMALKIAIEAGQVQRENCVNPAEGLFSEDLW